MNATDKNERQSSKTALIIDDDKSVLRVFSKSLRGADFIVDTAETGEEALEKIRNRAYDVSLIDLRLPDINGTDLLSAMKALSPNMVKIVITGYPTMEGSVKALEEGADAFLVKPVRREELLMIIEENLKKKRKHL